MTTDDSTARPDDDAGIPAASTPESPVDDRAAHDPDDITAPDPAESVTPAAEPPVDAPPAAPPPTPPPAAAPPPRAAVVPQPVTHPSGLSSDARTWAMLTHLSAFAATVVGFGFVGPLVMWLLKREEHPFLDHHGREALNFNLSVLLYVAVGTVLGFVTLLVGFVVILPAFIALGVLWFVTTIIAAVKANNGEGYRYPLTIRFLKEPTTA